MDAHTGLLKHGCEGVTRELSTLLLLLLDIQMNKSEPSSSELAISGFIGGDKSLCF